MNVLITGANGFLGRHVLNSLHQHNIATTVLGRKFPANCTNVNFIEADLLTTSDFSALINKSEATHLLHLAWYAEHGKYWTSPLNLRWVEASTRLIEAFCESGGKHVVVAGTCAEYDWSYGYCREDHTPLNPATLYGVAKDSARRLISSVCAQHQIPCSWGRIFSPFGAGEASQRLIPSLIGTFLGKHAPFCVNASAYRDFLHASDVADAFVALLRNGDNGSYNISSGQPTQLENLVYELARLLNADPKAVLNLSAVRLGEPPLLVGENIKLKALGWQPKLSLAQGLRLAVKDISQ